MKKYILLISILFFGIFGCDTPSKAEKIESWKAEIKAVEKEQVINIDEEMKKLRYLKEVEWPKAYREQDTVLLDRILGSDFQMITNDGEWSDKEKQMERIKKTSMDHDVFRYEIKRLEILENGTAIIAGTGHIINDNQESIYQSSNVLVKRNGIWKAVLSHVSGYKKLE